MQYNAPVAASSPNSRAASKLRGSQLAFFLLAFFLGSVLTSLVCNTAAGLACGLARGLALTASTVTLAKLTSFDSLDTLH